MLIILKGIVVHFFNYSVLWFSGDHLYLTRFAAALIKEPLWVMNTVPVDGPDTLPVIFDRGLIGIYHDWCEAFNTYPRSYDLLHSSFLFANLSQRYNYCQWYLICSA